MGGYGSTRWGGVQTKQVTSLALDLRIEDLRQLGLLGGICRRQRLTWRRGDTVTGSINIIAYEDHCVLHYRHLPPNRQPQAIEQVIAFDTTPCHYGGHRYWFLCPHCDRRVAVLYGGLEPLFLCRHCLNLTYECRNEDRANRMIRRGHKALQCLGGGSLMSPPPRPKGMHCKTYKRQVEKAQSSWIEALRGELGLE